VSFGTQRTGSSNGFAIGWHSPQPFALLTAAWRRISSEVKSRPTMLRHQTNWESCGGCTF
jgi:hypothetical protein